MNSIFINASLAAGVALASLPVILHLLMKPKPRRIVFPALMLVQQRHRSTKRRLRLKNWLLLLARVALIALMALALARPRLWSRTSLGDREVPTALALVFDTSLSMGYEQKDQNRLDLAKEHARSLLRKTHEASRVYVIDSSDPIQPPGLSAAAALKRIEALELHAVNRPLNQAVAVARQSAASDEQPRREVYVFSDLANSAWDDNPLQQDQEADAADGEVASYLVRLSPPEPYNTAVVALEPALGFGTEGEANLIQATLRATGKDAQRVVEFYIDGTKRDQKTADLKASSEVVIPFETPKLAPGLHRCEVRLSGEPDPLAIDDRRYLSLEIVKALPVLLVSDLIIDASFVAEALDPSVLRSKGPRPFPVRNIRTAALIQDASLVLSDFACVFLLNVRDLPESLWGRLNRYVRDGGGLVIAAGDRMDIPAWNERAAPLLPAELGTVREAPSPEFTFGKALVDHPLFQRNTRDLLAELARVPIYRFLSVTPNEGSRVLMQYQDGSPALLERQFAGVQPGRVLLWTTALARRPGNTEAERLASWTDFPLPTVGWGFFYLIYQTVPYLAGVSQRTLTFDAGENVVLGGPTVAAADRFTIQGPETQPVRLAQQSRGGGLLIQAPPRVGNWTVTAETQTGGPQELGFSVNVPVAESQLAPVETAKLDAIFGSSDRYAVADDPSKIEAVVDTVRIGRELFAYLMWGILILIALENALANTFYREASPVAQGTPARSRRPAA